MTANSHTPGPWYTNSRPINKADQGLVCQENTGENIAVTYDVRDAALIAAAPELLAALEETTAFARALVDVMILKAHIDLDNYPELKQYSATTLLAGDSACDRADSAIARAKGETA